MKIYIQGLGEHGTKSSAQRFESRTQFSPAETQEYGSRSDDVHLQNDKHYLKPKPRMEKQIPTMVRTSKGI